MIDKSKRDDGTFSRADFTYHAERDCYVCRVHDDATLCYLASVDDCRP